MHKARAMPKEEFQRRGDAIYLEKVRPNLTKKDVGKLAAIDIETEEYAIDADEMKACHKLRKRIPDAQIWMVRRPCSTTAASRSHPRVR